jgi:hypothetical protein
MNQPCAGRPIEDLDFVRILKGTLRWVGAGGFGSVANACGHGGPGAGVLARRFLKDRLVV